MPHVPVAQVVTVLAVTPPLNLKRELVPSVGTVIVSTQLAAAVTVWLLPSPATVVGVTEQPDSVNVPVVAPISATVRAIGCEAEANTVYPAEDTIEAEPEYTITK